MGRPTLGAFDKTSEDENRSARVEGGPLMVVDESDSALIYAYLQEGIAYSQSAWKRFTKGVIRAHMALMKVIKGFMLVDCRNSFYYKCPTLLGLL